MVKDKVTFEFDRKILMAGGLEPTEEVIKLNEVRKLFTEIKRLHKDKEQWKAIKIDKLDKKFQEFFEQIKKNYEPISYEKLKEFIDSESSLDELFVFDVRLSDIQKLLKEFKKGGLNSSQA